MSALDQTAQVTLLDTLKVAQDIGRTFELRHCHYGPPTGKRISFIAEPMPYYFLLAGLAATIEACRILEVGTHFAGASQAFMAGMENVGKDRALQVVTIDTNAAAATQIEHDPRIQQVIGEAQRHETMIKAASCFDDKNIDILFIDALKSAEFCREVLRQAVYQNIVPRYLVLDDITANASMKGLWKDIRKQLGEKSILVSQDMEDIRTESTGMAVVDLTEYGREIMQEISEQDIPHRVANNIETETNTKLDTAQVAESRLFQAPGVEENPAYTHLRKSEARAVYNLASQFFQDKGQIVTIRDDSPAITSVLYDALSQNKTLSDWDKKRRINVLGPVFDVFQNRGLESHILPFVNVMDVSADQLKWSGQDIELAIVGPMQSQKQFSNVMSEILAHGIPHKTYIVLRDTFVHYRLWAVTTLAMIGDFVSLRATDGRTLVIKQKRTVPTHLLRYVSSYNFTVDEMDRNLEILAEQAVGTMLQIDLLLQLGWLRALAGRYEAAEKLTGVVEALIGDRSMTLRTQKLLALRSKIASERALSAT